MTSAFNFSGSEILITGGSDGIGLGLASRFLRRGARVMITGRSVEKLQRAAEQNPGLLTLVNDISVPAQREALAEHARSVMPALTAVVNNAGIQRRISLAADDTPWLQRQAEIDTLFSAPIHLNHLLLPLILRQGRPGLVVNVTSGGAFVPQPFAPVYSACKAAMHSYTVNLRFALAETHCRVVELIPPAVRTGLPGVGAAHGVPLDEFCDSVVTALASNDADEIGYGMTDSAKINQLRSLLAQLFQEFSTRFPVQAYASIK